MKATQVVGSFSALCVRARGTAANEIAQFNNGYPTHYRASFGFTLFILGLDLAALVLVFLILLSPLNSQAQDGTGITSSSGVLRLGDVAVSGFSGVKLQVEGLPPGVDPVSKTVIDPEGITLRVLDGSHATVPFAGQQLDLPLRKDFKAKDIGQVFGLAFDSLGADERGNPGLFAGATSAFGLNIVGPDVDGDGQPDRLSIGAPGVVFMEGQFGPAPGGGAGAIWRVDAITGELSLYGELANSGPGLGGLAFDPVSRTLYASNLDTGLIHHFSGAEVGLDVSQFDHGVQARPFGGKTSVADDQRLLDISSPEFKSNDPASWGITQLERRVDAMAVHGGRLFYSAADGPEIWSVGLSADGNFQSDPRIEFAITLAQPGNVTAITFDGEGRMLVAIRNAVQNSGDFTALVANGPADVMRFTPESPDDPQTPSTWLLDPEFYPVGNSPEHRDASGGLALQYAYRPDGSLDFASCHGTLLASGDALGPLAIQNGVQIGAPEQFQPTPGQANVADFLVINPEQTNVDARGHAGGVAAMISCGTDAGLPAVAEGDPQFPGVEGGGGGGGAPDVADEGGGGGKFPDVEGGGGKGDDGQGGGGGKQGKLTLVKTATVQVCNPKGGCAFNVEVRSDGAAVKGPIVINELIEAPQAALTGEPNAPWLCSKAAPFVCTHPGPVPANGKLDMRVVFAPNLPPEAKEVRNCARVADAKDAALVGRPEVGDECATVSLDPKAPVQLGPVIVAKKGGAKCTAKGPCTFSIAVQNITDKVVNGPIVIDEQIDAPSAAMAGEPNAPWSCSKTKPFTCSHPGPLPPESSVDLTLSFTPNAPAGTKQLKNCAIVKLPLSAPPKKAELFTPSSKIPTVQLASFLPQSIVKGTGLLQLVDNAGGSIGGPGVSNKCIKWRNPNSGFVVREARGFSYSISNLVIENNRIISGDVTSIDSSGPVVGKITQGNAFDGAEFNGTHYAFAVKWKTGNVFHFQVSVDAAGAVSGTASGANLTGESRWWKCEVNDICDVYSRTAEEVAKKFNQLKCGPDVPPGRWSKDRNSHLAWCMSQPVGSTFLNSETETRRQGLAACQAERANFCTGYVANLQVLNREFQDRKCTETPAFLTRGPEAQQSFCSSQSPAILAALENKGRELLETCKARMAKAEEPAGGVGDGDVGVGGKALPPAPEQCAVVDIEDNDAVPAADAGDKNSSKTTGAVTSKSSGIEITKVVKPGATCTEAACPFTITIKNISASPLQGPIEIADQIMGETAANFEKGEFFSKNAPLVFKDGAIVSGPAAPWTCTQPFIDLPFQFNCTHPGPLAAGETFTLDLVMKLGTGTKAEAVKNCTGGDEAGSCAMALLSPPPKSPASAAGQLSLVKTARACNPARFLCDFDLTITNTGDAEFKGPIQFADIATAEGKAVEIDRTTVNKQPSAWTCTKAGPGFNCSAEITLAPKASVTVPILTHFDPKFTAKEVKNCATLTGTETPSCVTVPFAEPVAQPKPSKLVLAKNPAVEQCSDLGGGCGFTISITNPGPEEFVGPLEFTDSPSTVDGKAFLGAEIDGGGQAIQQLGVTAPISCSKVGDDFVCSTGVVAAKIPAGKTVVLPISLKPGAAGDRTAIKNCAALKGGEPQCATIPLIKGPLLRAEKIGGGDTCVPSCSFAINLKNVGNTDAIGPFVIDDKFTPAGDNVVFEEIDGAFNCGKPANGKFVCISNAPVLRPGESIGGRVKITGVTPAPEYTNCIDYDPAANGKPSPFDTAFAGRCVTIKDTAPKRPNLVIKKQAPNVVGIDDGHCDLKSACRFNITVTNTGSGDFVGQLVVVDNVSLGIPEAVSIGPGSSPKFKWECDTAQNAVGKAFASLGISCKLPLLTIPPGTSVSLEVAVTAGSTWKGSNRLGNCAEILPQSDVGALDTAVLKSCAFVKLDPFAVKVTKTGDQTCKPGGDCHFRISLFNPGPIDHVAPVTITDQLIGLSAAQIVSITPASAADPFPCTPAPTQVPFTCTSPGDYPLMLETNGKPGPPKVFDMVVRLPSDASAEQFSNCASASSVSGESSEQSCVTVVTKQTDTCFGGMVLNNGACACPDGTKWNGKICDGTGGINQIPEALPVLIPLPVPVKCAKNQVLDKATNNCVAKVCPADRPLGAYPNCCPRGTEFSKGRCVLLKAKPVVCGNNQVLDKKTNKCVRRKKPAEVCPADRPIGTYPNCCPEGTEFRKGKCRPPQQEQEKFCEGDRPNGVYPNCCPDGYQYARGKCRRIQQEQQPDQNDNETPIQKTCPDGTVVFGQYTECPNDKPVVRDCGEGYRTRDTPNQYGNYCDLIPVPGPDPEPPPPPQPQCRGDQEMVDGQCIDLIQ